MASLNKVLLMGNLTRDPQLTYLPSQTPVVEFGMAMNRRFKKQDGTDVDETCFVDCRMLGKRAETIAKFFKKGDPIFVEGRLQLDQWEKDGKKQSKLRVIAENFEFVGRAGGAGNAAPAGRSAAMAEVEPGPAIPAPDAPPPDDDIPF